MKKKTIEDYLETTIERITESGCWIWMGALQTKGYGDIRDGKPRLAHRAVYEKYKGKIDDSKMILHICDNRSCVNPEHLFLGDAKENFYDSLKKGRASKNFIKRTI